MSLIAAVYALVAAVVGYLVSGPLSRGAAPTTPVAARLAAAVTAPFWLPGALVYLVAAVLELRYAGRGTGAGADVGHGTHEGAGGGVSGPNRVGSGGPTAGAPADDGSVFDR